VAAKKMKKILIADDAVETRTLMKMYLQKEGYLVIDVANGRDALDKAKSERPDLIVLDVIMPVLDGVSTAIELSGSPLTKDIPIIISTTRGQLKDLFELSQTTKIKEFIEKPFKPAELVEKVKEILK
jgi:CheY-like chemotaxis protein